LGFKKPKNLSFQTKIQRWERTRKRNRGTGKKERAKEKWGKGGIEKLAPRDQRGLDAPGNKNSIITAENHRL